jgi:hypothetical protein
MEGKGRGETIEKYLTETHASGAPPTHHKKHIQNFGRFFYKNLLVALAGKI